MASVQELGERIARNSALVNKWLASKKCKIPSFHQDADQEFPSTANSPEIETARLAIIDDTSALHDLIIGPGEVLRRLCWGVSILYTHLRVLHADKINSLLTIRCFNASIILESLIQSR